MNRQARHVGPYGAKTDWLSYGNVTHQEAATRYARANFVPWAPGSVRIETRDDDRPETVFQFSAVFGQRLSIIDRNGGGQ